MTTWKPPEDPEFSVYYDTLCFTDDVEAYEDGSITIEYNGLNDIYTTVGDLEALLKRIKVWMEARKKYKESNPDGP